MCARISVLKEYKQIGFFIKCNIISVLGEYKQIFRDVCKNINFL